MKFIVLLFLSTSVFANTKLENFFNSNHATKMCAQASSSNGQVRRTSLKFIKYDDVSLYYASSLDGISKVIEYAYDGTIKKTYSFEGKVTNISFYEDEVIFLVQNKMFVVDKNSKRLLFQTSTLPSGVKYSKYANANGVYVYNDIYYIAHGKHGIVPYDKKLQKHLSIIKPNVPQPLASHKSMITDIVGSGSLVYLTFDDVTLSRDSKAFEGLMIFDLLTESVQKLIPVNQKREAYYMSNLTLLKNELIITNLHLNFVHKLNKLQSDRYMRPQRRIWKYSHGKLLGRAAISENRIYGCFLDEATQTIRAGVDKF